MKKKKNTRRSPKRHRDGQKPKRHYHIRNWSEYNASLVQRGCVTVWIEQTVLESWCNTQRSGHRGASQTYSDTAILMALTLKGVYHLPLRATQGLLESLLSLMGLAHLPVPDYSTLCRRQKSLKVPLGCTQTGSSVHLVVDSTGCKVYGEGEWKVRQHGVSKRRTWRKLHLGIDEATGEIVSEALTTNDVADSEMLEDLIECIAAPLKQVSGDGGYDKRSCYEVLQKRQEQQEQGQTLQVAIPPRKGARIWQHGNCKGEPLARDENVRCIRKRGRKTWKEESGYHRRSLAETTMFRYKRLCGDKLSSRHFESQKVEARIGCAILNRMTHLGRPHTDAL